MLPIHFVRTRVFRLNQTIFARIAGTVQSTVSEWELGKSEPRLSHLIMIRAAAKRRHLEWDDAWLFEPQGMYPAITGPSLAFSIALGRNLLRALSDVGVTPDMLQASETVSHDVV